MASTPMHLILGLFALAFWAIIEFIRYLIRK